MEDAMKKLTILLWLVGAVQLILGALYLFVPAEFIAWMKLSAVPADTNYALGMLAARLIAYGIGMFVIARDPARNLFWIKNMILIQLIDLSVGVFYTLTGIVPLSSSAFPMFNAILIAALLFFWMPKQVYSQEK